MNRLPLLKYTKTTYTYLKYQNKKKKRGQGGGGCWGMTFELELGGKILKFFRRVYFNYIYLIG